MSRDAITRTGRGGFTEAEIQRAAEAFERDTGRPPSDIAGDDPVFVELYLILAGYLGANTRSRSATNHPRPQTGAQQRQ